MKEKRTASVNCVTFVVATATSTRSHRHRAYAALVCGRSGDSAASKADREPEGCVTGCAPRTGPARSRRAPADRPGCPRRTPAPSPHDPPAHNQIHEAKRQELEGQAKARSHRGCGLDAESALPCHPEEAALIVVHAQHKRFVLRSKHCSEQSISRENAANLDE